MPIIKGRDGIGSYYRFGKSGVKYHYRTDNESSRIRAYNAALTQMRAIKASQSKKK